MATIATELVEECREEDHDAIERVVDYAYWQLMLRDSSADAQRLVSALCSRLIRRMHEVRVATYDLAAQARLEGVEVS